jgi:DNA adenine methylase
MDRIERAARFVYLNRHCFNGVYRTNKEGQFNVPLGTKAGIIPDKDHFRQFARALRNVQLLACDFERTVTKASSGDFVYLDPPYSRPNIRYRGEYGYGSFSANDLHRLASAVLAADKRGAAVLLSYNSTIAPLLPAWYSIHLPVRRSVAGFNHQRALVMEVLISNRPFHSSN